MELGEQVIHFECEPNCSAPSYTVKPGSTVYARDLDKYLKDQAETNGFAVLNDPPGVVPSQVAKFGIYLHWVADRASHWYCCDASGSGVVTVRDSSKQFYNNFLYLGKNSCNFINHGMVHYVSLTTSALSWSFSTV